MLIYYSYIVVSGAFNKSHIKLMKIRSIIIIIIVNILMKETTNIVKASCRTIHDNIIFVT